MPPRATPLLEGFVIVIFAIRNSFSKSEG